MTENMPKTLEEIQEEMRKKLEEIRRDVVVETVEETPVEAPVAMDIPTDFLDKNPSEETVVPVLPQKEKARGLEIAVRIITDVIFVVLVLAILGSSVLFAFSRESEKSILGYRLFSVLDNSQKDSFKRGDMVLAKVMKQEEVKNTVKANDIIVFHPSSSSDAYLIRRVTEVLPDYKDGLCWYRTKGDNEPAADPFAIPEKRVVGVVGTFKLSKMGYVMAFIRANLLSIVMTIVLVCGICVFLRSAVLKKKKSKNLTL